VLVAVAGYRVWPGSLAHLGVVTHPGYRGRGYGTAVVQRMATEALREGLVPQYRAQMGNGASIAIATALGFEPCATSLALRLKPSAP
jgi:predicted GNAT family acetyltransferase